MNTNDNINPITKIGYGAVKLSVDNIVSIRLKANGIRTTPDFIPMTIYEKAILCSFPVVIFATVIKIKGKIQAGAIPCKNNPITSTG